MTMEEYRARRARGERLVKAFEKLTDEEQENATRSIEAVAWLRKIIEMAHMREASA